MNNKELTIDELRQIQLGLLDAVDAFCEERGLRYSLGGGSLLGAVRHKGFIPWDDDVDLMMPRPDYEIFINEFVSHNISIQHLKNSSDVYMPFAKVYDIRTVLVEHYATNGVFIDLFPIEGLPSEKHLSKYLKIQKKYCDNLYHLHDYKYGNYLEYDNSMPKTLVKLKYFIKHLFYYSKARTIKGLDSLYNSYQFDTAEYAGAICGAYGAKEHMDKNVFTNYISLEFEGRMYKCIAQYDAYLTKHYGDYMKLPPVDKQKASHHFKAYWKEYGINGAEY